MKNSLNKRHLLTHVNCIFFGLVIALFSVQLNAQCPPQIFTGPDTTILCGSTVNLGQAPTPPPPPNVLAPGCTNPAQLTQMGGSYTNSVSTTGGITNITNMNTLVNGLNPLNVGVPMASWYNNYTAQVVESTAGGTFNVNIQGTYLYNTPLYFRIWIDWNNDGTFNNTNEMVWTSTQGTTHTAVINVPANQQDGLFRMRIRSKQNCQFVASDGACTLSNPVGTNCAAAGYGPGQSGMYWFSDEIEDYSVKISGGTPTGGGGNTTFLWTPPTGLSATDIPNPTATPTETTTYTLTVTDTVNNCSSTQLVTVTVAGVITATHTVGPCANDLYAITGIISTTAVPTSGDLVVEDCNGNITTIASAPFTTTSFPYSITGQTANGNTCDLEIYFTAANCPETINFAAPAPCTGCLNPFVHASTFVNESCSNADGTITLSITSGGTAPFTYSIDNGVTTQSNGSFTGLVAGTYQVLITDDQGCSATQQITLTNTTTSNSTFDFADFCQGANNGPSNIVTPGGTFSFSTSANDGATIHEITGIISDGIGGTTYNVIYTLNGPCPSSSNQQVTVNPNPNPDFDGSTLSSCEPIVINFSNNLNIPGASCAWNFGNGATSNSCNNATNTYTTSGTYAVTLTVTSQDGCVGSHTEQVNILITSPPVASFTANPINPSIIDPHVVFTNQSTNSSAFHWNFGDNATSSVKNPSHTYQPDVAGNYVVTLIAYNGLCSDTARLVVNVKEELVFYVPNAFTPDGDRANPIFKPVFSSGYDPQNYQLLIFDRWGELIFESHDTEIGWDGTYLGTMVQDNSYIWKIDVKERMSDKIHSLNGHLIMIR